MGSDPTPLYETIGRVARDAIAIVDGQGLVRYWNPAAEALFGYSAEEMAGAPLHEAIVPERYRAAADAGMKAFAETGQGAAVGQLIELTGLCKDGRELPVELSLSATQLDGRWHAVGVVRDTSDRRHIQDTLMQQLQLLNALVETIPSPVFYKDRELRYRGCNQAAAAMLGLERRQIIGATSHELMPPEIAARYHEMDLALLQTPGVQHDETKYVGPDGVERSLLVSKATYRGPDGEVAGMVGVMTDLTGLTVALSIAQEHAGDLVLESHPGGPTRVTLVLPVAAAGPTGPAVVNGFIMD